MPMIGGQIQRHSAIHVKSARSRSRPEADNYGNSYLTRPSPGGSAPFCALNRMVMTKLASGRAGSDSP
eukprot:8740811-Alexandrium_andersonii.AAC.1